jgi:protein tyrosine phosphatase (PTP) superfamily phosphohydrolase (DUF442 family)
MHSRRPYFALLLVALVAVGGCATLVTGNKQADLATNLVLAELEPAKADVASQRYDSLAEYFVNFGVTNDGIYRGAQPDLDELQRLKDAGIATIINFRDNEEAVEAEAAVCATLGLTHHNLPWSGHDKNIDPALVERFLEILDDPANLPAFVHCHRGAERTGTMLAVYRMERDGWTAEQAYREMKQYRFRSLWFGNLKDFVLEYEPLPAASR